MVRVWEAKGNTNLQYLVFLNMLIKTQPNLQYTKRKRVDLVTVLLLATPPSFCIPYQMILTSPIRKHTVLFISHSGISELDCATTKTDTAERSISIGRESLQIFCTRGLGVLPSSTARGYS